MLTKGAIGNLVNRYRAVLTKCNLINTFGSLAMASRLVLGGAGMAGAVSYDTQQTPSGTIDLSTVDGEYIVNNATGTAISSSNAFALGTDKNSGKIELTGASAGFLTAGSKQQSIVADTITLTGTADGSNALTVYSNVNIEGNNITINGKYNAIHMGEQNYNENAEYDYDKSEYKVSIKGKNVSINTENHIALHGSFGGEIYVEAENLTINAQKAIQTMHEGSVVDVKAKVANIEGDIYSRHTDNKISLAIEEGTFKGRIRETSKGDGGVTLTLGEKATWVLTNGNDNQGPSYGAGFGDSALVNLNVDGTIDMSQVDRDITVTNSMTGEATVIMDAAKENKIDASEADTSDATITAVATQNADNVTKAQAAEMVNRLEGVQNKTAEVAGGLGKDGYTVTTDENGNAVVSGGGASDVTKTVLQQASVTTVALDKLLTNDVRKRLGDIRSDKNTTGVWMRWDGGKLKGDAGLANNFNTIQIGGDTKAAKNCRIGFAGSFTHGDMDFNRGGGELEGFSFALYGTWMGENGMFADVVARLGKFSTEMNVEGNKGDMDNRVASLSAECGWRFDLAQQFFIEPQVELAYTYVSSDDLQLGDVQYQFDSVDSLTGRAGVVAGWNLPDERGNVYARASVVQQFMGDAKITGYTNADPVVHETDGEDTWLEYGIGANVKLTDNTYVWADVERTEGADIEEEWRGTVGIRYSF